MNRLLIITFLVPVSAFSAGLLVISLLFPHVALAADNDFELVIRNHKFQPSEITVPSGQKFKIRIENQDDTPEEFESNELNREKVIAANGSAILYIGPLDAGRYPFFGEFNKETAQGVIIAK